LVEKRTRRLFVIDHGLCFHEDDKLRTVLWDFAGEEIPSDLLTALDDFRRDLSGIASLRPALAAYLTRGELSALSERAGRLVAERRFPSPPADRRAYPYPPL
jgi:uncharacterized repeat protein (TIGR03843 family)